ncbi:hypothetical protein ABIE67_008196 [Streptomyces sp. V4I8]
MYEMYPALDEHGIAVVWHMKSKGRAEAMCGHRAAKPIEYTNTMQADTAPHCRLCMTSFTQLMS